MLKTITGLPSEMVDAVAAKRIRDFATKYAGDRRLSELYEYLFAAVYGPIRRIAQYLGTWGCLSCFAWSR